MSSRIFHTVFAASLLALLGLTVAVYWSGLDGPFLLDDIQNIVRVHVADFDVDELLYAATHNTSGRLGRPVSVLSLAFSGIVHGLDSWGYKYHNLLIHLLNGLLLFWLLFRLLPKLAPQASEKELGLIAGLSAAVWLLHPLQVSTVLYAVQRMAQLSALFTLLALLLYTFARSSLGRSRHFYLLAYVAFPFALLLALLSKENGALIPLYLLAIEALVYRFRTEDGVERNRLLLFQGLFVGLPLLLGTVYVVTHFDGLTNYTLRDFTLPERLMTQLHAIAFYLKLILLPRLADMSLYHDDMEVIRQFDFHTIALLVLLAASVLLVFALRRRAPVIALAIAWFLVSHALESTFISLELVFEHRNYLAAAGPLFAVIHYLSRIQAYPNLRYVPVVIILLLAFMTNTRAEVWKSAALLSQIAVLEHPRSHRANTEAANLSFQAGNVEKAIAHLDVAQQLKPGDFGAVLHEVVYRCGRGEDLEPYFEEAEARAARRPASNYALNALDNLLSLGNQGKCPELRLDSVMRLVQAAKQQQGIASSAEYTGYLERIHGHIALLQGRYEEGVHQLTKAYELIGMTTILEELARIQMAFGKLEDAAQVIARLERINAESFGIETAKIEQLRTLLSSMEALKVEMTSAAEKGQAGVQ